jgi:primosomal protein N' (replication factor Y)
MSGKQVLILVPEIRLVLETVNLLSRYFNASISVFHSSLSNDEKLSVWFQSRHGLNSIVIGTRAALFIPLARPGIIIIDKEHDRSYKQRKEWYYQARDLAIFRAREDGIPVIMGSATPAIETIHNVHSGKYYQFNLMSNDGKPLQQIVDLRNQTLISGISPMVIRKMEWYLNTNSQVLLFLNSCNHSLILSCNNCGWNAKCPHCSNLYVVDRSTPKLGCRACHIDAVTPDNCLSCSSKKLSVINFGVEHVAEGLSVLFPNTPILYDHRGVIGKSSVKNLPNSKRGILIGTNKSVKNYRSFKVKMIVLLDIDCAMLPTDFRSGEYLWQMYSRIVGQAKANGEIFIQTHYPNHPLLQNMLRHDYLSLAKEDLFIRRSLNLPPWSSHALFRVGRNNYNLAESFLNRICGLINSQVKDSSVWIMGPSLFQKRDGSLKWQLLVQHNSRKGLQFLMGSTLRLIHNLPEAKKINWSLDIDPDEY